MALRVNGRIITACAIPGFGPSSHAGKRHRVADEVISSGQIVT